MLQKKEDQRRTTKVGRERRADVEWKCGVYGVGWGLWGAGKRRHLRKGRGDPNQNLAVLNVHGIYMSPSQDALQVTTNHDNVANRTSEQNFVLSQRDTKLY